MSRRAIGRMEASICLHSSNILSILLTNSTCCKKRTVNHYTYTIFDRERFPCRRRRCTRRSELPRAPSATSSSSWSRASPTRCLLLSLTKVYASEEQARLRTIGFMLRHHLRIKFILTRAIDSNTPKVELDRGHRAAHGQGVSFPGHH